MSETMPLSAGHRAERIDASGDSELVSRLLSIAKSTRALVGLKLGELGFHNGQDELLFALDEGAEISVSRLADELSVRPSTVSKMLDRLITLDMAERTSDGRDARRTMVRITPKGLDARSRLFGMREKLEAELTTSLSGDADAVADTLDTLDTLAERLKLRLARLR